MIDFIQSRCPLPSLSVWATIFPLGLFLGTLAGELAGFCRVKWTLPVGYTRKIFHFLIFTMAALVGGMNGFPAVQVFGTAVGIVVGYSVLRGNPSKLYQAIARPSDAPYERFYIITPFLMTALGGMTSNILFGSFAMVGYIATGWGDAVGEPVGTRWGKHRYRVPALSEMTVYRSFEGSLAVFLASWMGIWIVLGVAFHQPYLAGLGISLILALATALVEAFTYHSMDNLTIQVISSGTCAGLFFLLGLNI